MAQVRRKPSEPPRAWQRMISGRRLDLLDPSPMDVEIDDIAHGLARVARWNGQTIGDHAFSVAEHSVIVEQIVTHLYPDLEPKWRLAALLHDSSEYVIGDMISPFKAALGVDYKVFEDKLETAVHVRFGLPAHTPVAVKKKIKRADRMSAYFEATQIAGFSHEESADFFGRPPGIVVGLNAVIFSINEASPHLLVLPHEADGAALPFGPFDPLRHRTFEIGLREWVSQQANFQLGFVEQLYTFGDRTPGRRRRVARLVPVLPVGRLARRQADTAVRPY